MKIKVGGVYRTRGGEKVIVKNLVLHPVYPIFGVIHPNGPGVPVELEPQHGDRRFGTWTVDGSATTYMAEHHDDIVAPWEPAAKPDNGWVPDEPEVQPTTPENPSPSSEGTRIRFAKPFKPGDWVKVVDGAVDGGDSWRLTPGDVHQVVRVSDSGMFVGLVGGGGDSWLSSRFEPASDPHGNLSTSGPCPDASLKDTNPKDAIGSDKLPLHLWPTTATAAGSIALLCGALKYGRANWRHAGVRATIYADAIRRHLDAWLEGEEVDPDDGVPHLWAILAGTAILVDAKAAAKLTDDRHTAGGYREFVSESTAHVKRLKELHKGRNPKHYTIADLPQFP
jgi:hypothetical protein